MLQHRLLFGIAVLFFCLGAGRDSHAAVELHAHLFMNKGMTWAFDGDFHGPLQADSWDDFFSSQANPEAMDQSGLRIAVASLYAHPLFTTSLRDSIRRQIAEARRFVREHPNWIIATGASEARRALAEGKNILILSLEGASGILETKEDIQEFVIQGGIRIVTLLHLTDDHLGGAALLKGFMVLSNPIAWLRALVMDTQRDGIRINSRGLTHDGRRVLRRLIQNKVWIDLAHASTRSFDEMMLELDLAGQPALVTHTVLRKYHHAERGISEDQLSEIQRTSGVLGLMTSPEYLAGTPAPNCEGTFRAWERQLTEARIAVSPGLVVAGSDFNGGVTHLKPSSDPHCRTGTSLDEKGLWQIGQSGELWDAAKIRTSPNAAVEAFLRAWENVSP